MRDTNSNLPPEYVLEALRRPMRLQRVLLTPAEIDALRKRAKERSAYFRKAFADLRLIPETAEAEARRAANTVHLGAGPEDSHLGDLIGDDDHGIPLVASRIGRCLAAPRRTDQVRAVMPAGAFLPPQAPLPAAQEARTARSAAPTLSE